MLVSCCARIQTSHALPLAYRCLATFNLFFRSELGVSRWSADSRRHYTVYASIAEARPIGLGNWPVEFSLRRGAPPKTAKPRQLLHGAARLSVRRRRADALTGDPYCWGCPLLDGFICYFSDSVAASPVEMEMMFCFISTAATTCHHGFAMRNG